MDEKFPDKLARELTAVHLRTQWIGRVLAKYLNPTTDNALVAVLGVGDGEELLHIRQFVGDSATIHSFDTAPRRPDRTRLMATVTNSHLHFMDFAVGRRVIERRPDLVICRHPRIVDFIEASSGEIDFDYQLFTTLASYAKDLNIRGQMLITLYTQIERDKLYDYLTDNSIPCQAYNNKFAPQNLRNNYSFTGLEILAIPDGFVIKIP